MTVDKEVVFDAQEFLTGTAQSYECSWFAGTTAHTKTFPATSLMAATPDSPGKSFASVGGPLR
jgi:hypothetical protein